MNLNLYEKPTTSKASARKRAQRAIPAKACSICGSTHRIQRHHPDILNRPLYVIVACVTCHKTLDRRDETVKVVRPASCLACGKTFQPIRTQRSKICGDPNCLKEIGRRSAAKRWGHRKTGLTDSVVAGTD